ncbi:hypothetical protein ACELLULO517_25710 [Acidisoma cellulosilytica]|uniref:DUF5666 domain-containing protein n=1 Tax=Acidisoma cellulosilyticum TaxID=2802395 RepID=A0A963Z6C1_9PROT|nr:DUF5666 domain-containing protein [Acidisoma cellulosilyticum]MCB8883672.1 hypothetical protein [Acidisoma cellulosilyticum]
MKNLVLACVATLSLIAVDAGKVQAQTLSRVRGIVTALKGDVAQITTHQGNIIAVNLSANTKFADVTYAKISDIKPGSFIGTAAVPQPDGSLKALEVHVFAAALRGSGEGTRAWQGDGRKGSMTNGTVGDLVVTNGRTMTVSYRGGQKKIVVPSDVPIVFIDAGSLADLTPGEHIIVFGENGTDGTLAAERVLIGRNGLVPPM